MDSVLEDRQVSIEEQSSDLELLKLKIDRTRRNLAASRHEGNEEQVALLRAQLEKLVPTEKDEAGKSALRVEVGDIQAGLAEDQAILEFIQYNLMTKPGETRRQYGVAVYRHAGTPTWVSLDSAEAIDQKITAFSELMEPSKGSFDDDKIDEVLRSLYEALLTPVSKQLAGVNTLLICPDANLGGLSFSVLIDEDNNFACERWKIAYVSTSRDILRQPSVVPIPSELVILADPDFSNQNTAARDLTSLNKRALVFDTDSLIDLGELPGTRREMEEVSQIARDNRFRVSVFSGELAQELVLRQWDRSPDLLHFATHGLILPPTAAANYEYSEGEGRVDKVSQANFSGGSSGNTDNALRRSMLALTGANTTFSQWREGKAPDSANDGLLSAEEVASLNLHNTSLAVLSACDTASGEALSGEGVFGLRRGFLMAGVNHLLVTFWPIADEQTVELMSEFYSNFLGKEHPASALRIVQRESLSKWADEFGLGTAVYLAGPFALSTSGPIP